MLPAGHRLRRRQDFATAVRRGRRAGRPTLVVHLHGDGESGDRPRAGFVVSRAVGGAVTRNTVRRRLRHVLAARLPDLPAGSVLVVRANPPAATATSAVLASDLDRALARLLAAAGTTQPAGQPAAERGAEREVRR